MFHLRAARKRIGLSPFCVRRVWSISSASHRNPPTIITTRHFPRSSTRCGSRDKGRVGVAFDITRHVEGVQSAHPDEKHMLNLVSLANVIVGASRCGKCSADQADRQGNCEKSLFQVNLLCSKKEDRNDLARWRLGPACYRRENAPCPIMNRGELARF